MKKNSLSTIYKIIGANIFLANICSNSYAQTSNTMPQNNLIRPKMQNNAPAQMKKQTIIKQENQKKTPPMEKENSKTKEEDSDAEGLFGPIRIGPMVGFGIFMGPNISLEAKIYKYIGLSFSYAKYSNLNILGIYDFRKLANPSTDYSLDSLKMSYTQYEGKISIFPWGETFFIGTAFGQRKIELNFAGTVHASIPQLSTTLNAPIDIEYNLSSTYITPQIGWLANWSGPYGGFAIGTEFGVQVTLYNTVSLNPTISGVDAAYVDALKSSSQYTNMKNDVETISDKSVKQYPLPYWNIIKVGWLF